MFKKILSFRQTNMNYKQSIKKDLTEAINSSKKNASMVLILVDEFQKEASIRGHWHPSHKVSLLQVVNQLQQQVSLIDQDKNDV